ncbi:unnamed protein product [Linum trigynum]|uniref:Uncharacterized protein n=1 Tax=Linum trigynum TaxID=586398 RepID=A0AAV2G8Y9_9ROSI
MPLVRKGIMFMNSPVRNFHISCVVFHEIVFPFQQDHRSDFHWVPCFVLEARNKEDLEVPDEHLSPNPPLNEQVSPASPPFSPTQSVTSPSKPVPHNVDASSPAEAPSSVHNDEAITSSATSPSPRPELTPPRRSDRVKTIPRRLDIYDLPPIPGHPTASSAAKYPLSAFVSYDGFNLTYHSFLAAVLSHMEPRSFQ